MIEITSYLRDAYGRFSTVDTVGDVPADPLCVEGAIELTVDGKRLIGTDLWDYVDQLWAYLGDMVLASATNDEVSTYFPDQPVKITFRRIEPDRVLIVVEGDGEARYSAASREELFDALRGQGVDFFRSMIKLLPVNKESYEDAMSRFNQNQ